MSDKDQEVEMSQYLRREQMGFFLIIPMFLANLFAIIFICSSQVKNWSI